MQDVVVPATGLWELLMADASTAEAVRAMCITQPSHNSLRSRLESMNMQDVAMVATGLRELLMAGATTAGAVGAIGIRGVLIS